MTNISLSRGGSPSSTRLTIGDVLFVFSYETCVAFRVGAEWVVSENVWSNTTGRHITQETPVPKADRLPREDFQRRLAEIEARLVNR